MSEINQLQQQVANTQSKLDETTQANLRQRKTILELRNSLNNIEEDEKKENTEKALSEILIDLNNAIEQFKKHYNKQKLQEIFDNSPKDLMQNDSNINKCNDNTDNIILSSKSFSKYLNNIQSFVKKISNSNINEYKTWNLEQIIAWISSLDNGKYVKYIPKLREGFIKREITRSDLSSPPFSINQFVIKRDLAKHFELLAKSHNDNEGAQTQYIDK